MRIAYLFFILCVTNLVAVADPPTDFETLSVTVKTDVIQVRYPKAWKQKLLRRSDQMPTIIIFETENGGQKMTISLIPTPDGRPMLTNDNLERGVRRRVQKDVAGSVEQEAEILGLQAKSGFGFYTTLTDASLVDKDPQAGDYLTSTVCMMQLGRAMVGADLLSNEPDSTNYTDAIDVLKNLTLLDSVPEKPAAMQPAKWDDRFTVSVPNQNWDIRFISLPLEEFAGESPGNKFRFKGRSQNFNITLFVEDMPDDDAATHEACYQHYWNRAKRNPLIDPDAVVIKKQDEFVEVAYQIDVRGQQMLNRNYYFAHEGKWVDIHISVMPTDAESDLQLAQFGANIQYGAASHTP